MIGRIPAQVYAPAANDSFNASYTIPGGPDKVFVFNKPSYKAALSASIIAVSTDRLPGWSFQWSVFDPVTKSYIAIPAVISGDVSEIDTITVSSGYQVTMSKGADNFEYRIWLLINDLDVNIINKDAEDKLLFGYYNCSSLDLRAVSTETPLSYYNPVTQALINVGNAIIIRWQTDNDDASTPARSLNARVTNPPSEDTWYILTLSDQFGIERSDSVYYESIQSKAEITTSEYIALSDSSEYEDSNYGDYYADDIQSAPGKYRFDISGSRNMASYEIDFGDEIVFNSDSNTLVIVHEYEQPGTYKVVLTTKSGKPYECIDSVSTDAELKQADAENFGMPNVFTPNGDGINDKFRCADVSVLTIDIAIFNRAGLKVHSYAGNIRDWEGWDGNIKNSARQAPEGVYFYVITTLTAYEDKANPLGKNVMKGFLHLYRNE